MPSFNGARSRHHCTECKKSLSARCFAKGHAARCTATLYDGRACNQPFAVISTTGCSTHRYNNGHNIDIYNRRKGYEVKHHAIAGQMQQLPSYKGIKEHRGRATNVAEKDENIKFPKGKDKTKKKGGAKGKRTKETCRDELEH